jgi:hypothetical protein
LSVDKKSVKNQVFEHYCLYEYKKNIQFKVDKGDGGPVSRIFSVGKNDRKPAFIRRKLTQKKPGFENLVTLSF